MSTALGLAVSGHLDSYDAFVQNVFPIMTQHLNWNFQCDTPGDSFIQRLEVRLKNLHFFKPQWEDGSPLYPSDARMSRLTYTGSVMGDLEVWAWKRSGDVSLIHTELGLRLGHIPVMVNSLMCHLRHLSQDQRVALRENHADAGGYFIFGGAEKICRHVITNAADDLQGVHKDSLNNSDQGLTPHAVVVSSRRPTLITSPTFLHLVEDGSCLLATEMCNLWTTFPLIPIMKGLNPQISDYRLMLLLCHGSENQLLKDKVEGMLIRSYQSGLSPLGTLADYIAKSGAIYNMPLEVMASADPEQLAMLKAEHLLKNVILPHCPSFTEKFDLLVLMFVKLHKLATHQIQPEDPDVSSSQCVVSVGQLMGTLLHSGLTAGLMGVCMTLRKFCSEGPYSPEIFKKAKGLMTDCLSARFLNFLATGNLRLHTRYQVPQDAGWVIEADRLNQARFLSHFRSIHRGSNFSESRQAGVRDLRPEAFGFICSIHTPDGMPCGILCHLAARVRITSGFHHDLPGTVAGLLGSFLCPSLGADRAPIVVDARPVGYLLLADLGKVGWKLRKLKGKSLPAFCEVVVVQDNQSFNGIFVYSGPQRLVRPVYRTCVGRVEWIGPHEQLCLQISAGVAQNDRYDLSMNYTHFEIGRETQLSLLALMTPFQNMNPSPRNMFQCQMLKQTMGVPFLNWQFRTDTKAYRLQTPQLPLVKPRVYNLDLQDQTEELGFSVCPTGTNVVVAVASYTGYDMEDAMIISKGAFDRGIFRGNVLKTYVINSVGDKKSGSPMYVFRKLPGHPECAHLDEDGLVPVGMKVSQHMVLACSMESKDTAGVEKILHRYSGVEDGFVEQVALAVVGGAYYGDPQNAVPRNCSRVTVKIRCGRMPTMGDKFAARCGQKGVLALVVNQENMPFSDSSVVPDILFNPHGFPSRMTVGMLVEAIAGKGGALQGMNQLNATSFRRFNGSLLDHTHNEEDPFLEDGLSRDPAAYFGDLLTQSGFQGMGCEEMYSGLSGELMVSHIFMGVLYYQRLRHMVDDKFQARQWGPVDAITRQPVHGRKCGGGVRFGEMERDSLAAHGACHMLLDRFMSCSDKETAYVCPSCQMMTSSTVITNRFKKSIGAYCQVCQAVCQKINIPYALRMLVAEIAACNVKVKISI